MSNLPHCAMTWIDTPAVGETLCDLISRQWFTGPGRYLELGVFRGMTMIQIAEKFPAMHVTGVDRWQQVPKTAYDDHANVPELPGYYFWLQKHYGDRCRLVRSTTEEAAFFFQKNEELFDLIFIDAGHTYDAVRKDIELFWPLVDRQSPSGAAILAGHDYSAYWPGVKRAVDEFCAAQKLDLHVVPEASVWWVKAR